MKEQINNLPLFRKILLFSFFVSLILVVATAGISLLLQTKQMEKQLRFRVVEMSALWGTIIDIEDIKKVITERNREYPSFQSLMHSLSIVNENAPYTNAVLLEPKVSANGEVFVLVSSEDFEKKGVKSLSFLKVDGTYVETFNEAIRKDKIVSSPLYQDELGFWITSFVPISDHNGKLTAILAMDINAAILSEYQKNITLYLIGIFVVILFLYYFVLKRGLRKFLNPVNEIISGFNEVSKGNFEVKLKTSDQSDLGILVERFNAMTNQLSQLFERLSATTEQFGTGNKNIAPLHRFEEAIDEMEQILQRTKIQRELQRAEKMNAIGQLAASVAHEIRNPMTVVKGFLQIFLAKEQMSDEERMYIRLMIEEMHRAETIINDYLSLAKPDIEHMELVDAGEFASRVMDLMNSYAMMSKNISIEINLNHGVYIKSNPSELRQVLINILKNGIEAMKDGGNLNLSVYKENGYGVFKISDTGIGMSNIELERLGTPFYSLKEKGTGIGMMVCYQIIDRMKGKIEVESEVGIGTTFNIFIPLAEE
ncbi:sensor histidine kinase [Cytobacillus praedii]|uniref:histidine kinase n=1 Tax=Cytobacillus praedii TaxID=1742358 RepID=A0A4R1AYD7_9BACI|nr:HAMP domain-containing sensor histidine kinase [Cytobacillus praedii]TCJ05597.1 HAMP domain-containing protein [Cytobacillus praedii]